MLHKAFLHEDKTVLIFIKLRTACLRTTLPTVGYDFLYQLATKKMVHRHAYRQTQCRQYKKILFQRFIQKKIPNDTGNKYT